MLSKPADPTGASAPPADAISARHSTTGAALRIAGLFLVALALCVFVYLVRAVPGAWFPSAMQKAWTAESLSLPRGNGRVVDGEVVVTGPDANGLTLVSTTVDFKSSDYPVIAWIAIGLPEDADVHLIWRSNYAPERLNNIPINVEASRSLPTTVAGNPAWVGQITGLALGIRGPITQPVRIRGVVAKPMGAWETIQDRAREWFAFEPWTGTSINTTSGGADVQAVYLPVMLAAAVALAALLAYAIMRRKTLVFGLPIASVLVALFFGAWLLLDVRSVVNLARQTDVDARRYAGKSLADKHLSAEDGNLYAFIQQSLPLLPRTPARVFIGADDDYFRGRAAYHLYPHSAYYEPRSSTLPPASSFRAGDWLLVYRLSKLQYDAAQALLTWAGGQQAHAQRVLSTPNAALFRIE